MIKLTPRLEAVASLVNQCVAFADIGTDHAYLASYIVEHSKAQRALASDINPNPLKNAEATIDEEGLNKKIELRLSDGFNNIKPFEAQEFAVAGMGGIMIAEMIDNTPWLKDNEKHLVLQPITHFEDVRRAVIKNGFEVEKELTVCEGRRVYLVLSVRYKGDITEKPPYWYYVGNLAFSDEKSDRLLVDKTVAALEKKLQGLRRVNGDTAELEKLIRSIKECQR